MVKGEPLTPVLQKDFLQKVVSLPVISIFWMVIRIVWIVVWGLFSFVMEMIVTVANESSKTPRMIDTTPKVNLNRF